MGHPEIRTRKDDGEANSAQLLRESQYADASQEVLQHIVGSALLDAATARQARYTTDGVLVQPDQVWPSHNPNQELQEAEAMQRIASTPPTNSHYI